MIWERLDVRKVFFSEFAILKRLEGWGFIEVFGWRLVRVVARCTLGLSG